MYAFVAVGMCACVRAFARAHACVCAHTVYRKVNGESVREMERQRVGLAVCLHARVHTHTYT